MTSGEILKESMVLDLSLNKSFQTYFSSFFWHNFITPISYFINEDRISNIAFNLQYHGTFLSEQID